MSWHFILQEMGIWWRIPSWGVAQSHLCLGRVIILGPQKEGGWRGVHTESVLPDKVELTLLDSRVFPPVNLRWHLGAPTMPEPRHGAPLQ